jgi:hypothetical protein
MTRSLRIPPIAVAAAALGFGTAVLLQTNSALEPESDRDAMIGTWTDEDGEPGNSIRFFLVTAQDTPDMQYVSAHHGHATIVGLLGRKEAKATWNYGQWDPLVLNVMVGRRAWFVAIRKLDDDHLLMRFGTDAADMYRPDAIEHPDTRRFRRIGREPGP